MIPEGACPALKCTMSASTPPAHHVTSCVKELRPQLRAVAVLLGSNCNDVLGCTLTVLSCIVNRDRPVIARSENAPSTCSRERRCRSHMRSTGTLVDLAGLLASGGQPSRSRPARLQRDYRVTLSSSSTTSIMPS
eukprot:CAMPEP_0115844874 /NCGR_PEP_ID=MMETSP0287-20121206/9053_1 /TAXON_ID=412157 /ORGANISM="Chrysochromulina rotalis, Strain UIO044" /LENGTH=134 /DNA_ID=CAMNT_0003298613 /DNA_START=58 /DNA_END=458 /DNA_ORIENTATION=-